MTRQKGRPEPFEWISVVERPVESTVVDAAIATFVSHFVVAARRERARLKLGAAGHRAEALHALESWLDPKRTTALEGNTGFRSACGLASVSCRACWCVDTMRCG